MRGVHASLRFVESQGTCSVVFFGIHAGRCGLVLIVEIIDKIDDKLFQSSCERAQVTALL